MFLEKAHNLSDMQLPTPIKVDRLIFFLQGYNHALTKFLEKGFSQGFPLHYQGTVLTNHSPAKMYFLL